MKKILIPLLAAAILTVGCKSGAKKNADGTATVSTETDADAIISYTNDVIDVLKEYTETSGQQVKHYESVEKEWATNSGFSSPYMISTLWTIKEKAKKAFGPVPAAMGDDCNFFRDSLSKYNTLYNQFQSQDSILDLYIKAQDFKDDKYAKGKEIIAKLYAIYPQLRSLRASLSSRIESVADAAEEVVLKNSPIRESYKVVKADLASYKKLANVIVNKEKYTDADLASIDSSYTALIEAVAKHAAADQASLVKEKKAESYKVFYDDMNEKMAELKPVIRDIKSTKVLTESDYNTIDNACSAVIRSYNSWVN